MTKISIYNATRRRMAHYMEYIHQTYYDNTVSWDIKFDVICDYKHEALAVLNFAYSLGAMSEHTMENMYDKFNKFVNHYRHKMLEKQW